MAHGQVITIPSKEQLECFETPDWTSQAINSMNKQNEQGKYNARLEMSIALVEIMEYKDKETLPAKLTLRK